MALSPARPVRRPVQLPGARTLRSFWPGQRVRRPVDAARLVVAAASLTVLVVLVAVDHALVSTTAHLVPTALSGLSRTALSVGNVAASLAVIGVLLAIAFDALRTRRFALTCATLACSLGVPAGLGVALLAGTAAGSAVVTMLLGPPHESAGLPVTAAVALVTGADLRGRRRLGAARLAITAAVICALALGSLTVPSAAYAVLVGLTAGLAVRVVLGVVPARPSEEVIRSVLAEVGWQPSELRPLEEAAGRVRHEAVGTHDGNLWVTVVDPDRRGVPFARRAWRTLWLRTAAVGRPTLSLRGQLERQALCAALARSAGVAAPRVLALLAAGPSLLLVEQPVGGTPLPAAAPLDAVRGVGAALHALRRMHDTGLALGALTADGIVLLPHGRAGFTDLTGAQPAASELQRELDVVTLLVAAGRLVGADEAVAAMRAHYGSTRGTEARLAALLQPLILPRPTRRALRGTPLLDDLRSALSGPGNGSPVTAVRLQRLRARTVISVAGATLATHILATQLSTVSVGSALGSAQPVWFAVALLGSAVTYVGAALALQAVVPAPLPLLRTIGVQLASSFLTLVTPPTVGQVGLNIRYLHRSGVPTPTAAAGVAVKEAVTVAVTVPLLLICGWLSGVSASRLSLLPSGDVLSVLAVSAVVVLLAVATPPVRRLLYRRLEPLVRRTLPQLLATAGNPRRLAAAVGGILLLNGGYVLALDASLRAFATSLALPTLVVVYLAASTLGSVAPTPGGLGAVEAALVGALTAAAVPVAAALTAVLVFRAATFWLPAPPGWVAFTVLQRRGRI
jgi:uncharacterized membrane protein YbhN (UPF0104 family)